MSDQDSLEISVSGEADFSGVGAAVGEKAKDAFDALGTLLTEAIDPFRRRLAETLDSADEVELKLDLALKGGGKWVVVSMEAASTVSVKLVWKKKA